MIFAMFHEDCCRFFPAVNEISLHVYLVIKYDSTIALALALKNKDNWSIF